MMLRISGGLGHLHVLLLLPLLPVVRPQPNGGVGFLVRVRFK